MLLEELLRWMIIYDITHMIYPYHIFITSRQHITWQHPHIIYWNIHIKVL